MIENKNEYFEYDDKETINLVLSLQRCDGNQVFSALRSVSEENLKHIRDMINEILMQKILKQIEEDK